jgi:hypothetical protein
MFVLASTLVLSTPLVFAQAPVENYEVEFLGVTYDEGANTSRWCYLVTCFDDPAISHIDFEFKFCDPPLTTVIDANPEPWETGIDGSTGLTALKFDDLSVNPGESITVCFTLEGLWAENGIDVYIKAGQDLPMYNRGGPACFVIPEVAVGSIMAVAAMFTALGLFAYKKKHSPTEQ